MPDLFLFGDVDGVAVVADRAVVPSFFEDAGIPIAGDVQLAAKPWAKLSAALEGMTPSVVVAFGAESARAVLGRDVKIEEASGTVLQSMFCERVVCVNTGDPSKVRGALKVAKALADAVAAGLGQIDVAEKAAEAKSIQLRDDEKAQFEQRIIQAEPFRPGKKYIAGWSDGADVVLLRRDEDGDRETERVTGVPWYFFMKTDDALRVPREVWRRWLRRGVFVRIEADGVNSDWTKVHAVRKITQTRWLMDRGEVGVGINILDDPRKRRMMEEARLERERREADGEAEERRDRKDAATIVEENRAKVMEEARRWVEEEYARRDAGHAHREPPVIRPAKGRGDMGNWSKFVTEVMLRDFLDELHRTGPSFEADLTPKQRFMTDHYLEIDDHYNELYFDIETDDSIPGWENKETWRHLSYAAVLKRRDGEVERHSITLAAETDRAEKRMLEEFRELVDRADILYAWNGFNFDFPILRARFRKHWIDYDWRNIIWCDLLAVWRRYHYRSASAITSYSLDSLGPKVLKMNKLDWRTESAAMGTPVNSIIEMYRQLPDLLMRYNENDAEMLYRLEQEFGYAGIERVFCRIGNCFVNDYHVSTKIDMLLLNKGAVNGDHYYTRGLQLEFLPKYIAAQQTAEVKQLGSEGELSTVGKKGDKVEYTGAYVFPPVVGYHEGVAALDFKSLYPTIMTLFNISPETWVSRDVAEAPGFDMSAVTRTPSGAYFKRDPVGMIPLVFRETMEKRKVYSKLQLGEEIGSERFLLYYRLSYAYKRLGLSFYGEIGNETSRYFNPETAEAVTLGGQWFIKKTAEFAGKYGYRVLAGDTDSIYLAMTQSQAEAFVKECDAYYKEILKPFNVDMSRFMMELEYENYFRNIIFVKKKRYAGKMTIFKGKESDYLEVKGLECMRSDGLERGRAFQRRMLEHVLGGNRPPLAEVYDLVVAEKAVVYSGTLAGEDVQNTQSIEKSVDAYKTKPPHVRVAHHIREVSTEYYIGMKVPYVMVKSPPDPKRPERYVAPVATWTREYVEGTYDPTFLWNKKIYPPTMRVLEAAYPEGDWEQFIVDQRPVRAPKQEKKPKKKGPIIKRRTKK